MGGRTHGQTDKRKEGKKRKEAKKKGRKEGRKAQSGDMRIYKSGQEIMLPQICKHNQLCYDRGQINAQKP